MAESINNNSSSSSKVKVNEVTKLTPFSDSVSTVTTAPFTLPLTYFDTLWFKFPSVERLFFYEFTDLTSDLFNSIILPKLKHSLSLTLIHYLPLAGNLMWPSLDSAKPAIYYFPNDGVSVTVAESNAVFDHLSGNGICEAVEFHPLIPQLSISEDKAEVIALQVTSFPNKGFAIGISSHHAVLDGKSSTMFIKAWAYLCKQLQQLEQNLGLLPDQLTPCFDRTVIKDPKGLDMLYVKQWMDFTRSDSDPNTRSLKVLPVNKAACSNLVRMTFELSSEDIKKLRDKVQVGQSKQLHLSSFVITYAHVCVCLVKAKGIEANTTVKFAAAVDCRSRLDPPIPVNYFGNCVGGEAVCVKARDLITEENGVAFAAEKLSDSIKGLKGDDIQGSEDKIVIMFEVMKERGQLVISVAGSNRFDVYGSDFGWGRPKKVEIVSIDRNGAFSLAESKDERGGFEIGIVLEKQQMEVFASLFVNSLKYV